MAIEIPFKDAPQWVQQAWKTGSYGFRTGVPRVYIHSTEEAKIDTPYSDYVVRDIYAKNKAGQVMEKYVPPYDSLISSTLEEQRLYFGGGVHLNQGDAIAVMDTGGGIKTIDLYVHPLDYQPPELLVPKLTERQMKILASVRSFISLYRREVFEANNVTQRELDELRAMGLIDKRGAITLMGRNVVGDADPLERYHHDFSEPMVKEIDETIEEPSEKGLPMRTIPPKYPSAGQLVE
jgi:hypothetical protein